MMRQQSQQGFTLVEMIMVIVITGIIGGMVAVFLKAPIQQYMDVARRADMTDIADTALRRIGRDLRLALPNSVRVAGTCTGATTCFIEFLPTTDGGRYRAEPDNFGAGDPLEFTFSDTTFDVLGRMPTVNVGEQVVVYNLGIIGADAYAGNTAATHNRRAVTVVGASSLTINSPNLLPFDSCQVDSVTGRRSGCRFHIVSTPVSYVCAPVANGIGGTLTRYWGYAIQDVQTKTDSIAELNALVSPTTATRGSALLATNVSNCRFAYDVAVVAQRSGLVTMNLAISESGETVTLYNATHVSNQP